MSVTDGCRHSTHDRSAERARRMGVAVGIAAGGGAAARADRVRGAATRLPRVVAVGARRRRRSPRPACRAHALPPAEDVDRSDDLVRVSRELARMTARIEALDDRLRDAYARIAELESREPIVAAEDGRFERSRASSEPRGRGSPRSNRSAGPRGARRSRRSTAGCATRTSESPSLSRGSRRRRQPRTTGSTRSRASSVPRGRGSPRSNRSAGPRRRPGFAIGRHGCRWLNLTM